ncbi:unnamed protein product, partial [Pylaiella littoralis]
AGGGDAPPASPAAGAAGAAAENDEGGGGGAGWASPTTQAEPYDGQNGVYPGGNVDTGDEGDQGGSNAAVATLLVSPPTTDKEQEQEEEEKTKGWEGEEEPEEQWQVQSTHTAGSGPEGSAGAPDAKGAGSGVEESARGGGEALPSPSSPQPNELVAGGGGESYDGGGGGGGGGSGSAPRNETLKGKACTSGDDCGANGYLRCSSGGVCECRFPWSGASCEEDGCQTHASSCDECREANKKAIDRGTSFGCAWESGEAGEAGGVGADDGSCRSSPLPLPLDAFSACAAGAEAAAAAAAAAVPSINEPVEAPPELWYAAGLPLLFVVLCGGVLMLGAKCIRKWSRGGSDGPDYTPVDTANAAESSGGDNWGWDGEDDGGDIEMPSFSKPLPSSSSSASSKSNQQQAAAAAGVDPAAGGSSRSSSRNGSNSSSSNSNSSNSNGSSSIRPDRVATHDRNLLGGGRGQPGGAAGNPRVGRLELDGAACTVCAKGEERKGGPRWWSPTGGYRSRED